MGRDNHFDQRPRTSRNLKWVDSHCHLEMLKEDIPAVLAKSREMGVFRYITIGIEHNSSQQVDTMTQTYSGVFGTVGCHPHSASQFEEPHLDWMRRRLETNRKLLGLGECGFDLFYRLSEKEDQRRVFIRQLELSAELKMPVVVHTREAEKETRELLEAFHKNALTGVFHCFTSSLELAKYVLNRGFYISFNGICTFPKSDNVRAILKYTPLDRILLETDSPYLSPVPVRGKPNFPGNVSIVGSFIADYLQIPTHDLAAIVRNNLTSLFSRYIDEN